MDYEHYTIHDFLEDSSFRQWVLGLSADPDDRWEEYLHHYPAKAREFETARDLILLLGEDVQNRYPELEVEEEVLAGIRQKIREEQPVRSFWWKSWLGYAAAASIVVLLTLGYVYQSSTPSSLSYENRQERSASTLEERINSSDRPLPVSLADGSTVVLKPGSRMSFPARFDAGKLREVYLSGEAFFEVTKNPKKPFVVYSNELVTKVLGTSFNIRAYSDEGDVTVQVRSGKVSVAVAEAAGEERGISKRERDGILLLPNQQAVLSRRDIRLVKELVDDPVALSPQPASPASRLFIYENTSVSDILEQIERVYGIDIVFEQEAFAHCLFNGDLTEESLFQKLDILCRSVEATYQMLDAQIIIHGDGCTP